MAPLVSSVLNRHTPAAWSHMSAYEEVALLPVSKGSTEYQKIMEDIEESVRGKISSVVRVQNPYLWGSYLLKKEEYNQRSCAATEYRLFHVTAEDNVPSIVETNLDWRRARRTKYGQGVSFSPSASYGDIYCSHDVGYRRAIIIARVLVGTETRGGYGTKIPPLGYDTTTGRRGNVYVKYSDNEFYPDYVAYYTN